MLVRKLFFKSGCDAVLIQGQFTSIPHGVKSLVGRVLVQLCWMIGVAINNRMRPRLNNQTKNKAHNNYRQYQAVDNPAEYPLGGLFRRRLLLEGTARRGFVRAAVVAWADTTAG